MWEQILMTNLQPWEKVLLVLKRHWIALVYVFWYVAFLVISVLFVLSFKNFPILWTNFINIVLTIYISVFLIFIYINWMRYELDIFIITNRRIIGLEEISFLNRRLSECSLDKVQEVNAQTSWLLSSLLNYWLVTIRTASEISDIKMEILPDAFDSARTISNLISEHKNKWFWQDENKKNDL